MSPGTPTRSTILLAAGLLVPLDCASAEPESATPPTIASVTARATGRHLRIILAPSTSSSLVRDQRLRGLLLLPGLIERRQRWYSTSPRRSARERDATGGHAESSPTSMPSYSCSHGLPTATHICLARRSATIENMTAEASSPSLGSGCRQIDWGAELWSRMIVIRSSAEDGGSSSTSSRRRCSRAREPSDGSGASSARSLR